MRHPMLGNLLYAAHRIGRSLMVAIVVLAFAASAALVLHIARLV